MHVSAGAHREQKCWTPGGGVTEGCELSSMASGNQTHALQKSGRVSLTVEPSLQPPHFICIERHCITDAPVVLFKVLKLLLSFNFFGCPENLSATFHSQCRILHGLVWPTPVLIPGFDSKCRICPVQAILIPRNGTEWSGVALCISGWPELEHIPATEFSRELFCHLQMLSGSFSPPQTQNQCSL